MTVVREPRLAVRIERVIVGIIPGSGKRETN
jgi:hypothetical protein